MTPENATEHIHTLLWEYVAKYIVTEESCKAELHNIAVESNFPHYNPNCGEPIEEIEIQVNDEFDITGYNISENEIIVSFETSFVALLILKNDKFYHITSTAVGEITVPHSDSFDYEKYDFDDMNMPELVKHFDIIKDIDLHFEYVEYMGE